MPDIQLRFNKDMLVLSAPIDMLLARQGIDAWRDRQYLNLMEPDAIHDALSLEAVAGAQCVVTTTEDITTARLAHVRMDGDASKLAQAALEIAGSLKPQHVLAEIGPCGLPLDASSKSSLNENRSQYAEAARAFKGSPFDAYFLNGFTSLDDLKCALMGVAQVADVPVFASVVLGSAPDAEAVGNAMAEAMEAATQFTEDFSADQVASDFSLGGYELVEGEDVTLVPPSVRACLAPEQWPEALDVMADLGAAVVGFETSLPIADAVAFAKTAAERVDLPILAQLRIVAAPSAQAAKNLVPVEELDEYTPDTMSTAAVKLYGAGVQFLRASGIATPAYTGALAATVAGLDVHLR